MRWSAAMTGDVADLLSAHLLRRDGQEDLCFATWSPSTGRTRQTALLRGAVLPQPGERRVHDNASFLPDYLFRAAREAARQGLGLAFAHSHPFASGWQSMSGPDRIAEARVAVLARELTCMPLLGLTLAGVGTWSARAWSGHGRDVASTDFVNVRVVGNGLAVSYNDALVPAPPPQETHARTIHTWGGKMQATIARLRVAVVGAGSVGMTVADVLARTGLECVGVFEFDGVEWVNLDRLRGATKLDALLQRPKLHVARRLLAEGATAARPRHEFYDLSICESEGFARLLDFDLIFSCVDRPWPRHVLNTVAYADLIPVIDGGLRAFRHHDGSLRNAYWRTTIARPGRACLACLEQYNPAFVQLERDGSLEDPSYLTALPYDSPLRSRQNVAIFATAVAASLLQQFVSSVVQPSGCSDPGPLRFSARDHSVVRDTRSCEDDCPYLTSIACGDLRLDPTGVHLAAERARRGRQASPSVVRLARAAEDLSHRGRGALSRILRRVNQPPLSMVS
jgi:molybdopterin/thiamine biosynthesis adenylyltransferase